jgi:pimeloyl-ACP methyl ester carboxylesterase
MVLAHERTGDGPRPIVVLHGVLGSARNLRTLAQGLAADGRHTVVGLDLAGHGASPPLPSGADLATLADHVLATVHALSLTAPLALVGHSLGGRVGLHVARRAGSTVDAVVLLDIPPGPLHSDSEATGVLQTLAGAPAQFGTRGEARAALVAGGVAPMLADWLVLNLEPASGGYTWRVDRQALRGLHARWAAEDLWPIVEAPRSWSIGCVRGGASGYVDDAATARLEAAGGRVITVAGAGHFLHVDRPALVLEAVASLLS